MNASEKRNLSSNIVQAKRKIRNLDINLSNETITQTDYDLYKSLLEDKIEIFKWQITRALIEMGLTKLVNHRSRTFITTQHDALVNKLNKIDYDIADLRNSYNKNLSFAKKSYPNIGNI